MKEYSYSNTPDFLWDQNDTFILWITLSWSCQQPIPKIRILSFPQNLLFVFIWSKRFLSLKGEGSDNFSRASIFATHCKYLNARFECNDIVIFIYSHYLLDLNAKSSDTHSDIYSACFWLLSAALWKIITALNPKKPGLFGGVRFGEMKFVLSNFLSSENLSISYKSWDVQLTFDTLINALRFKA